MLMFIMRLFSRNGKWYGRRKTNGMTGKRMVRHEKNKWNGGEKEWYGRRKMGVEQDEKAR